MNILKTTTAKLRSQIGVTIITSSKRCLNTEVAIQLKKCQLHILDRGPPTETILSSKDALEYYRRMKTIRDMEGTAAVLYREKAVRGFCHLYSGQEAVGVGLYAAMRPHDTIITSYRGHGFCYMMGSGVSGVLSELTGRKTGCVRGKGGSMHMYWKNFFGGNGIVGSQVPLGAGLAFAAKYKKTDGVSFTLFGDGAINNGQVFETFNLAKLLGLPVVFICENNKYSMGTSMSRSAASTKYFKRGDYIPGLLVDGMSLLDIRETMRFAIEFCKTNGPLMVEAETYRYYGHSLSDPGTSYRTREEVAEVRKSRDPINSFKEVILKNNLATPEELKAIDKQSKAEVDAAFKKSKTDPEIELSELAGDVYSNPIDSNIQGVHPWQVYKHMRIGKTENLK